MLGCLITIAALSCSFMQTWDDDILKHRWPETVRFQEWQLTGDPDMSSSHNLTQFILLRKHQWSDRSRERYVREASTAYRLPFKLNVDSKSSAIHRNQSQCMWSIAHGSDCTHCTLHKLLMAPRSAQAYVATARLQYH